ncbi:ABC-type multidrug transport system, ATPase and permease component [Streptomyces sp. Ncost-T6T-1]|uniref:ABC transporter ATP-binding protein n=1 Tax=Streptomyces sp. Ncost-T6T-1 TaxID=1100828 RepID=UPI0008049002|nr:ABC transporter ATP-binding protein [Streptomyces sp. Ncost-T6T-1]SBV04026.1 ABC-type multidrug transport system, ATPase and permease component [Streptomyces sp. Ncost-T6T-1]
MNVASAATGHALPVAGGRATAAEVWRLSRGHRLRLAAVGLAGILSTAVDLIPPVAIGYLVDRVRAGTADLGTVLTVTGVMALSAVLGAAGTAVTIAHATRIYHTVLAALRERLVSRAMLLPQHVVERAGTGDLISRSSDDVTAVADAAPAVIPALTVTAFTVVVSLAGLAALEWPYAVAFAVVLPVYALAMRWYLRIGPRVYRAERAAMSARAQQILESQRGYATVLGFGLAEHRHRAVLTDSWGVAVQSVRARTVQSMLNARLNLGECLSLAAVLVVGFVLVDHGLSTVGGATTAMLLVLRLLGPVNQLMFVVDTLQSALASLSRMIGVVTIPTAEAAGASTTPAGQADPAGQAGQADSADLADPSVPADPAGQAGAAETAAAVRLRGVSFRYADGPAVLDGIDLDIPAGRHIAIVGPSGAGKTTLASVIAGVHRPDDGTVTRPRRTAVISQEVHVFAGTLRENLTLAAPDATDGDIRAALETTGAAELLDLSAEALDTVVGTGGHPLTEAEAQQLALARLLLADPELAILDEATAEAGSAHAERLDRASEAVLAGRSGIVIAHRLSQAATCDRIVVMDAGRVIETGTHDELLTAGGTYARLWAVWQAGQHIGASR